VHQNSLRRSPGWSYPDAMTFQAYLDTITQKTGLGPDDLRRAHDAA
jgi:hypothetical protein